MTFDLKIENGLVFTGDASPPKIADIGVKDGLIAAIGECPEPATHHFEAGGAIVTPGFIDLHTHYDGQISWDRELRPSVNHGVTTALMGNCGIGFAPVRTEDRNRLVRLMEGVEDIPGTALHEGIKWDWQSFPEYLDAIEKLPHTIDFGAMIGHDPVRVFAMGERATSFEQATDDDIELMRRIVREGLEAGGAGFSIGRTDIHRTADGDWTPSAEASAVELTGIARAFEALDHGVIQIVNDFNLEREGDQFPAEWAVIEGFVRAARRPASISLMQRDMAPNDWRRILTSIEGMAADGFDFRAQVAPRAIGVFQGLQCTFHPLMGQPEYMAIEHLPLEERVAIMRDETFKRKCLADAPRKLSGEGSSVPPIVDTMIKGIELVANKFFRLGSPPNYEQPMSASLAAEAQRENIPVMEKLYDTLLELDGRQLIYFPIYNYTEFDYENVATMLNHPLSLIGLSDAGAHVGTICDASFPTFLLTYWARDREQGRIPLETAIKMLTSDPAGYLGLSDRGHIRVGAKADINVIDFEKLELGLPEITKDLPAAGQRLLQPVKGFRATFVSGKQVVSHDALTGTMPGRLVRFGAA